VVVVGREEKRVFHGLDGLRGIAALFVAMRHTSFFHGLGIHGGFLAVDLFFVLSGFVIAHAYERRLEQGLSVARFMALRYLRLWPVYVLGAVLGLIAAFAQALPGRDNMTTLQVVHTAPFALLMLPGPHIKEMLYPVNSVAWSLGLELLVNLVYALAWRPMRDSRVLGGVLAASAIGLFAAAARFHKLDVGFTWTDAWGGLPRVAFSFTAGLAIYRAFRARPWRSPMPAWVLVLILAPLFYVRMDEIVWPLVCVIVLFPAIVTLAVASEPKPPSAKAFAWLGSVSYPLYALHKPAGELVTLWVRHVAPREITDVWIGAVYLTAAVVVCALVEQVYDIPVRRLLTALLDRVTGYAPTKPRTQAGGALAADTRP